MTKEKQTYTKRSLYLLLFDKQYNRSFKKFFTNEFEMDKYINKLQYSKRIYVIEDSRDLGWRD